MATESSAAANQRHWDAKSEDYQAVAGTFIGRDRRLWGGWTVPDSTVDIVGDVAGLCVLEAGCGAAEWSGALVEDGARAVGLDLSGERLAWARRRNSASVPLVQADGHTLPFNDSSFDIVLSDHGAFSWCQPDVVVAEAARVLRPGGRLIFNAITPIAASCFDDAGRLTANLHRSYFDLGAEQADDESTWYVLPYGEWVRLLVRSGLEILDLVELRPAIDARTPFYAEEPPDWHYRWPAEAVWIARRR